MANPAVPGAINVSSLTGAEIIELHPYGQRRAQTTTQDIADLATAIAITSAAMKTWVLTLPTVETADNWWLNGNALCYGVATP